MYESLEVNSDLHLVFKHNHASISFYIKYINLIFEWLYHCLKE